MCQLVVPVHRKLVDTKVIENPCRQLLCQLVVPVHRKLVDTKVIENPCRQLNRASY